jgi:hypothetical protein
VQELVQVDCTALEALLASRGLELTFLTVSGDTLAMGLPPDGEMALETVIYILNLLQVLGLSEARVLFRGEVFRLECAWLSRNTATSPEPSPTS